MANSLHAFLPLTKPFPKDKKREFIKGVPRCSLSAAQTIGGWASAESQVGGMAMGLGGFLNQAPPLQMGKSRLSENAEGHITTAG